MIFLSDKTRYRCISECIKGKKMDVYICESQELEQCCIWAVRDNLLARELTALLVADDRYLQLDSFFMGELYCIVFPYREERNIRSFLPVKKKDIQWAKQLCQNIIFLCMSCRLPWELVYLLIEANKISLGSDGDVWFDFSISVVDIGKKTEANCAVLLGNYLEEILDSLECENWSGYRLLCMKNRRRNYQSLSELYQDICNTTGVDGIEGIKSRIFRRIQEKKPVFIRWVKVLCLLIGCLAIVIFISNMVFDTSPLYRLFVNTFKKIGTESMLQ